MKAIMSDTLREILRDPKKNMELETSLSKLSAQRESTESSPTISVGKREYNVQFVEAAEPKIKK